MIANYTVPVSDGVNSLDFEVVAKVEDGGYDWTAVAVLRRPTDGALFFCEDAGCSCYGFGESLTVADLKPLRKFEDAFQHLDSHLDRERLQRSRDTGEEVWT